MPMRSGPTSPARAPRPPRLEPLEARELLSALPGPGTALSLAEIKGVVSQVIACARQVGVNATIALVDREGNILTMVRMNEAALRPAQVQSTIGEGGVGGLEGISLPASIFAGSKAGTAAFLSTSGNAFSTRTAGFIIQRNFPGNVRNQPGGPLFGVQISSLPTSDLMRLPIGLAGDPGGLPLYRNGQVVAGVGVEFDGVYGAPPSRPGQSAFSEEEFVAAAALTGFAPPSNIRADNILVGGIRFAFTNTGIPSLADLGSIPDFDALVAGGQLRVLAAPAESPATIFTNATLGAIPGDTVFGFQQGYVEGYAVRGGDAFVVQPTAALQRTLSRIDIATGATTVPVTITGVGAGQLPAGHRVASIALDDRATADAADDLIYVSNGQTGQLHVVSAATGAATGSTLLGSVGDSVALKDAQVIRTGLGAFLVGISERSGNLVRFDTTQFGAASVAATNLTPVSTTTIDSFAFGEAGLFAVRAGPQGVLSAKRELVTVALDGSGSTLIADISNNGPNEGSISQPVPVLVYDNAGTAGTADDTLIAQNSTRGRQFRMAVATAAIGAAPVEIVTPEFVLTTGRAGPNATVVGVSELTRQLQRITVANPASAANLFSLTGVNATSLTRGGVDAGGNVVLSPAEVQTILTQAHRENSRLRAAIRRDRPQVSQVTVSVCDVQGNLLGVFRTPDAPVFGFDVSLQKARSAAFLSRTDAGSILRVAEGGIYAKYADASLAIGLPLDGSVALSERAIGFVARPSLPDGIDFSNPGPFSALAPDVFSPFNTGLQTQLIMPNIFRYAFEFLSVSEADAVRLFNRGLIGGGPVTASFPLQNGLQIFPGAVPLYKNGALVGAVGVSGDGIEQDDSVSFYGARGFQQFGDVKRADKVRITQKLRLPYIKFPRRPGGGF